MACFHVHVSFLLFFFDVETVCLLAGAAFWSFQDFPFSALLKAGPLHAVCFVLFCFVLSWGF